MAAGEHARRPGVAAVVGDPPARGRPALNGDVHTTGAPGPRGRSGALAGLVAGLVLVVGPVGRVGGRRRTPVPAAAPRSPGRSRRSPVSALPRGRGTRPPRRRRPYAIRLPALGVDAPGRPGRRRRPRPDGRAVRHPTVGWYRFGPGPGATAGSAVLSGPRRRPRPGLRRLPPARRPRARRPGRGRSRGRRRGVLPGGDRQPDPQGRSPGRRGVRARPERPGLRS